MTMRRCGNRNVVRYIVLLVLLNWCPWTPIEGQLNLYRIARQINGHSLHFDCLDSRRQRTQLAYQHLSDVVEDEIPYCFLLTPSSETPSMLRGHDQLTFEQMRLENITAAHLLSWSAPMDVSERYQFYLSDTNESLSNEILVNCSSPWFGHRCQYRFEFSGAMSIETIVKDEFLRRDSYSESSTGLMPSVPCYVHLKCDRGASELCLDWREVCDGQIDCLNGGEDESRCEEMELNECADDEYRCHNGMCIPKELWNEGTSDNECLDRSDERTDLSFTDQCYQDPSFRCEEQACRVNWHDFSCSDGQCVQRFSPCHSGRHALLIHSMTQDIDLPRHCSHAMRCLTKIDDRVEGITCEQWFNKHSLLDSLRTCPSIVQYPSVPIHLGHLRLLYADVPLKFDIHSYLYPDYICFDDRLCDCFTPTFLHGNLTCLRRREGQFQSIITGTPWIDLNLEITSYFSSCRTHRRRVNATATANGSLYLCANSSRWISKHRFGDEIVDCCLADDEDDRVSCSFENQHRVKCGNGSVCLSSLHDRNDCPESESRQDTLIPFHRLCDGLEEHIFEEDAGQRYTDESECDHWPCQNIYSRCDGWWRCSNGEDEENCSTSSCPRSTHPCVSPSNASFLCLPSSRVSDGIIDCLGASDEQHFCREAYPHSEDSPRFRCRNSDLCLSIALLCDGIRSCPFGDDELFCEHHGLLCQQSEYQRRKIVHFTLANSSPLLVSNRTQNSTSQTCPSTSSVSPEVDTETMNHSRAWDCHRGLTVRYRMANDSFRGVCSCPPSYYGDRCEYQNERVSVTVAMLRGQRDGLYAVALVLIAQDEQIESMDQFDYASGQSCSMKFNRYLVYSTRPKDLSKNYSVRIDLFEKSTMVYRGTWHLSIPFLFLPVNRLSVRVAIPEVEQRTTESSPCVSPCLHGQCVKYVNKNIGFCRCAPGWSGVRCDRWTRCDHCSPGSVCIGSSSHESICVCPTTKFGRRCSLRSSCSRERCENQGQCIPSDLNGSINDYLCICTKEFFGARCQYRRNQLDLSLELTKHPSYLLAFFLTLPSPSQPHQWTIVLRKLTLFQRVVTFHLSISYQLVVLESNDRFYLIYVESTSEPVASRSISTANECPLIEQLFNSSVMSMKRHRRVKFYHLLCQSDTDLKCFMDDISLCLCTSERHANCVQFDSQRQVQCSSSKYCLNEGQCYQDHRRCPSSIICVCQDCFFGSRCQFYGKGFGLTLDEILAYEIRRNRSSSKQSFPVQLTSAMTMLMFVLGAINGICSILTFRHKLCQEVGCGNYLLASSLSSLIIIVFFTAKFWFLLLSFNDCRAQRTLLYLNCFVVEPSMRVLVNMNHWFNACVSLERAWAVFQGIHFDKNRSKRVAKWIIAVVTLGNGLVYLPHLSQLQLFDDENEQRTWCVVLYSPLLNKYHSIATNVQFFSPFVVNVFSSLFIIACTAHQKSFKDRADPYLSRVTRQFREHKHLLISPILLLILSLPRLILSFTLDCQKSSTHFWLYLFSYFISFVPSILLLIVFVVPSVLFKKAFQQAVLRRQ